MSRILVTGGTGFLGTHLCARLREHGETPVALGSKDCDLTREGSLDKLSPQRWDVIYHLAAWTQAGDFCLRHPGEQWIINQQMNTNMLEWWSRAQPQAKLVFMGTSCSYAPELPLVESNYMVGEPIASLYTYAMTKRMLLQGARALCAQYGLRYLCLVPSTLYGPHYHVDGRQMHFVFDLIRKILRGRDLGEPVLLWGDGHQRRELVYVGDFVDATLALAAHVDDDLINVGAGEEHSIREFAAAICDITGYPEAQVQYDTSRYVGATSKFLDTAKAKALCPGYIRTSLKEGLARTIGWFEEHRVHLK